MGVCDFFCFWCPKNLTEPKQRNIVWSESFFFENVVILLNCLYHCVCCSTLNENIFEICENFAFPNEWFKKATHKERESC